MNATEFFALFLSTSVTFPEPDFGIRIMLLFRLCAPRDGR